MDNIGGKNLTEIIQLATKNIKFMRKEDIAKFNKMVDKLEIMVTGKTGEIADKIRRLIGEIKDDRDK